VELIPDHAPLVGRGVLVIPQGLELVRPVHAGALCADVNRPPPWQGLRAAHPLGRADTRRCLSIAQWLARPGGAWRTACVEQWERLCVQVTHWGRGSIGGLVECSPIFPMGHTGCTVRGRHHPALVPVRVARVCVRVWRTVA
jgi:hypothetical protein